MAKTQLHNDLFSSLISDIKSYTGKDPLFPWLRGIKKMEEVLPSKDLKEKLPRFLQKCVQTFQSDRRYKNDIRYLRVWLHLMDYVDEPRALLRTMEMNCIGSKRSLFYQAYALYYEKKKKFEESEKMYLLGLENLAEPVDGLKKSYEQFLQRVERRNNKKIQEDKTSRRRPLSTRKVEENKENVYNAVEKSKNVGISVGSSNVKDHDQKIRPRGDVSEQEMGRESEKSRNMFHGDDTVFVVKFVDKALVGKSEAEDACHHGLVDPTINTKEAMNAINNMFKEPIETAPIRRKLQPKEVSSNNGFNVFVDEIEEKGVSNSSTNQNPLQIFVDDEAAGENENDFVFPCPKDLPDVKVREDTVVHRFVGSTILHEPKVENVCHHGLVDPTVNLKEAMEDINNMFGKPIDFVRRKRPKQQEKAPITVLPVDPHAQCEQDLGGFSILPDDDLESEKGSLSDPPEKFKGSSSNSNAELFEPTVFTKEAMDDINKMFGTPLDF